MEVTKGLVKLVLFFSLIACSNTFERETGEIKTFSLLKQAFTDNKSKGQFLDARKLISREEIDAAGVPVIYIELASGKNGTLTLYPGQGNGQTWLGADGATVTFDQGVLKASRGLGDDLMGGASSMPSWPIINGSEKYNRKMSYLDGSNKIIIRTFDCEISGAHDRQKIQIWQVDFIVKMYQEICSDEMGKIENQFYLDQKNIVRKSKQFHSDSLGYIITERLERN